MIIEEIFIKNFHHKQSIGTARRPFFYIKFEVYPSCWAKRNILKILHYIQNDVGCPPLLKGGGSQSRRILETVTKLLRIFIFITKSPTASGPPSFEKEGQSSIFFSSSDSFLHTLQQTFYQSPSDHLFWH